MSLTRRALNSIRNWIREYAKNNLDLFDLRQQNGFLRILMIQTASTGDVMVVVSFFRDDMHQRQTLLSAMAEEFPQITSLMYVINSKANDTITDREVILFKGTTTLWKRWKESVSR